MKPRTLLILCACTVSVAARAGDKTVQVTEPAPTLPWSLRLDTAWVGKGDFDKGGDGSVFESRIQIAVQRPVGLPLLGGTDPRWVLRMGLEWNRYGFDHSAGAPGFLPGTLQSTSALIALEYRTTAGLGALFEARPGLFYEHDATLNSFDIPLKAAAVWQLGDRFALVAGATYSGMRKSPVIPVGGFWWKISDSLVLNAVPPDPRFEYLLNENALLWLGGEVAGGAYRTDAGRTGRLNAAVVDYTDYRASTGVQWKVTRDWSLEAGAGVSLYRKFDFQRAEVGVKTDDVAPFVRFSLRGEW